MHPVLQFITGRKASSPWSDAAPVREELFGVERLEQHARSLAAAQHVTARPPAVPSLRKRLRSNAAELLSAYRASADELVAGHRVVPAAEWLLDNYHVVEEQIREIHVDLPPGYYGLLPKLADGPFAGYPRVFGLAWAYIAHTDSHVDPVVLRRFIAAYQEVQPLDISELWAVAITLRIVLVENLRRLADQITHGRAVRADAQRLAQDLLAPGGAQTALDKDIDTRASGPLSEVFAAELAKRLRDQDPRTTPTLQWLDDRLRGQGTDTAQVIQHVQQRQGASNVSVRNVITSMRLMSDIDWADLFESVSLVDARLRAGSDFAAMDFPTRNVYRSAIEQLARGSSWSELSIAEQALTLTSLQAADAGNARDPGFYLIAGGRALLESTIAFKAPFRVRINRFIVRVDVGGYATAILALSALVVAAAFWALAGPGLGAMSFAFLAVLAVAAFFPASELITGLVHRGVTSRFGAVGLPALALTEGVPESLRTLVVIPTLLSTEEDLLACIEHLEVHHLAGAGGDLSFALLSDGRDADREVVEADAALITLARTAIAALNARHGPAPGGKRFYLLHRRRQFNASENCWMGWERKRGKLHELNRLLRGATDTSFLPLDTAPDGSGQPDILPGVRYVITLDADTRLPRDAALRLIGKIAHPLNQVRYSEDERRVVGGYAILQPRVTPALPLGREGSLYQTLSSGPGGMDPYAAAVSDVYQDLFGEGSYTGKGIYDVDAFEKTLAGRIPDNTLLSHDLFEGVFARAGLASDVEVVEEFPARYDVAARRQHRWTRGDWQLLPWLIARRHAGSVLPSLGRWKMIDNLRRSLLAPASLLALTLCAWLPWPYSLKAMLLVVLAMALPAFLPGLSIRLLPSPDIRPGSHFRLLASGLRMAVLQTLWVVALLPDQAFRALDAIARTLSRLYVTHRHLLEWTTAAQAAARPRPGIVGVYAQMAGGVVLALVVTGVVALASPREGLAMLPLLLLWLAAPAIAWRASRAPSVAPLGAMETAEAISLRRTARRTWRFFETFVTPADNMLPPDNFQEDPKPVVARRTSPTNMGLYLLSAVAARDFGWAGAAQTCDRLEATLGSMQKLDRFRGHFYNWYDTETTQVLLPAYVSAVDSGNLAGHLIALANACDEWIGAPVTDNWSDGADDILVLAQDAARLLPAVQSGQGKRLLAVLEDIDVSLQGNADTAMPVLQRLADKALTEARAVISAPSADGADLIFWLEALCQRLAEQRRDASANGVAAVIVSPALDARWRALAHDARAMAMGMDFAFLLDPERKLLSIGYNASDNTLDANCYDLLASEARLASLFAIAKGDVETRHWFRLGRTATPVGQGAALVSWSGSMFEYLMPSLVMRAPAGSLLEQTNRLVVQHQIAYGDLLGIPWGISESAYNARDLAFTYQYSNFGVPGLGLKRGLAENTVIAPYASGLATMVDPAAAQRNFERMRQMGALGHYGFYEALDFTRSRLPADASVAIVHNYMAHHQGMTIVAIANTLQGARMRERFHREPMIQACELLLQERLPRLVAVAQVRADDVPSGPVNMRGDLQSVRYLGSATIAEPAVHLLSNGRYAVMLTAAGGGYSRWRDRAVTRWREDVTCDHWGSYVYLREMQSGRVWSASSQPLGEPAEGSEVVFAEDHATFTRRDGNLTTTMEVMVSAEADGEVRRVTVANVGRRVSDVELTSYAEVVLATPSTDDAHPAFAKMFVQTEFLQEFGALIATRRPRTPDEAPIWAAHFAVVEGVAVGDVQYESDRGAFLGRGRNASTAVAMTAGKALSNTMGTVLDPVFSVRHRVRIAPGQVARLAFWTLVAPTREALLDLVDQHHDRSAFERARTLAWTQAQVQLRHIGIEADEAADFQRLAAPILFAESRFRSPADVIARGAGQQSGLWPLSVSGDLPIVLLRIDDIDDIGQVRQLLRAHEYWRMKGLSVDLVIVNERASSYVQDLQVAIDTAVRSSQSRPRLDGEALARGVVHTLRVDLMGVEARALLHSVARVVLTARLGPIAQQMAGLPAATFASPPPVAAPASVAPAVPAAAKAAAAAQTTLTADLECFNGLGGFADDGREYVTVLSDGRTTPAPWINVVSNPGFGFQVSADGSSSTWAGNSRENQLTPWSNDPVTDPSGEAFYVRDDASGQVWSPTAQPLRGNGTYVARHGHGYSRFTHESDGIALDLLQFVPLDDPIKISRLTIRNSGRQARRLSVTSYVEWVLGTARGASAPFILTSVDESTGVLLARNPWSMAFAGRVAFAHLGGRHTTRTADRTEFLGRHGRLSSPAALRSQTPLSGAAGAGLDPCAALQCSLVLQPGEAVTLCALLGQCHSEVDSLALVARYRAADLDAVLQTVKDHWRGVLGAVVVHTPDRAMDIMLNGWLLYQTLACRIWARSAFYQSSGAYGFRDQLQDGMALTFARPEETRRHLLRAAGRQFAEGDVQHWWLPDTGQGVRTHISDDRVWLAFATARYVSVSGDAAVLEESIPFLEGPLLKPEEDDAFFQPQQANLSATLFEHCARALDQSIALTGDLDLPLMGTGDWNDGMNRVGQHGKGQSVWLGWLLIRTLDMFMPLAEARDPERVTRWRAHREVVRAALEHEAWDGAWYRRATFDDGTWLGSRGSDECRIDSIAQSWAVLSGAADPSRAVLAMNSLDDHLIRRDDGLALLFTPPFDHPVRDPGYIKGYPPGLRENGGQYSHAAMWAIMAYAQLRGDSDSGRAHALFALINPINHARTLEEAARYRVEPYVVAADVYSVAPNAGRGGWTWYTGAAGWMHRAGVEGILGIRREGNVLIVDPCIPSDWPGFTANVTLGDSTYAIRVETNGGTGSGVSAAVLDGTGLACDGTVLRVTVAPGNHQLVVTL
jgi:cyclic beta-1,2-glucan synthetase